MKHLISITLFLIFGILTLSAQTFAELKAKAEKGDAEAQLTLAMGYFYGGDFDDLTLKPNPNEAVKWYRKAAEQGNAVAQRALGLMYLNLEGFSLLPQDVKLGISWLQKAANAEAQSALILAALYLADEEFAALEIKPNYAEAVKWFHKLIEGEIEDCQFGCREQNIAMNILGEMYEKGQGVEKDYLQAVELYRQSAEQENDEGQYNLGRMYENGYGVPKNDKKAVEWYRKAAENYSEDANDALFRLTGERIDLEGNEDAEPVEDDDPNNPNGVDYQFNLGLQYYNDGDYVQAYEWWLKAADQGNLSAQGNIGVMYHNGKGVAQDYQEAVKWYRKAAEQGDAFAQNCLGICYYFGNSVKQDYKEAVKWFRKAAEQGYSESQNRLGSCYFKGTGVTLNYNEAAKWYRQAAEFGHMDAQHNLGVCYQNGLGVQKNETEAVKWYSKAAEQGEANAKAALERLKK
ncbi:MAG: sel1 repeat family protein [Paludibacter sp.]|jgi:TPR repeat protein|nr:sel1 repeat family protein [Paludibacter sp.]